MTAARKKQQVEEIALAELAISPDETRRKVDAGALAELAESIKQQGVQEPLLVRRVEQSYEIVAGQRRYLACKLAGLKSCPCLVREMSDAQAQEARVVSNLQREDLPPLEEAMAFSHLLLAPGADIDTVAAKLAKEPGYIMRRLKLLDAIQPVRDALLAGVIEIGHALELARQGEETQASLLEWLNVGWRREREEDPDDDDDDDDDEDDEVEDPFRMEVVVEIASPFRHRTLTSVASLRMHIGTHKLRSLGDAPFPLDAPLPPITCVDCPKRSGNSALLFDDCAKDTCTDRICLDSKLKVWVKSELEAADREKRKLLMLSSGGNAAAVSSWRVSVLKGDAACECAEEAIWIDGERMGHRVLICREESCAKHGRGRFSGGSAVKADPAKAKREREALLAKVKAEKLYREMLFTTLAKAPISLYAPSLDAEICDYAIGRANTRYPAKVAAALGWSEDFFSWKGHGERKKKLAAMMPGAMARAALLVIYSGELAVHEDNIGKPEDLERLAGLLKVDVKKVRSDAVLAGTDAKKPTEKPAAFEAKERDQKIAAQTAKDVAARIPSKASKKSAKKSVDEAAAKKARAARSRA